MRMCARNVSISCGVVNIMIIISSWCQEITIGMYGYKQCARKRHNNSNKNNNWAVYFESG